MFWTTLVLHMRSIPTLNQTQPSRMFSKVLLLLRLLKLITSLRSVADHPWTQQRALLLPRINPYLSSLYLQQPELLPRLRSTTLSQDVGIPADLKDIVKPEDIPFLAQSAYDDACRPGNPKETSVEDITKLYESLI